MIKIINFLFLLVGIYHSLAAPAAGFKKIDNAYLYQSDMLLRGDLLEKALKGEDIDKEEKREVSTGGPRVGAAAVGAQTLKWDGGVVPYVVSREARKKCYLFGLICLSRPEKAISSAMKEWQQKTCIRFVERTNQRDYIEFIKDGSSCYSHVGRIIGRQVVSLGSGCNKHGIALHEIGHLLGMHHEQSRPDRDQYVTINYDNIQSGTKSNFQKYSFSQINSLGSPYDYSSIMHYEKNAFGKWPFSRTIETIPNDIEIGQRRHLSVHDVATINKYYGCK